MQSRKTTDSVKMPVAIHDGPPPDSGKTLFEREIPSDPALVTPLMIRALECLRDESLVEPVEENKVALCLEEALQNAVQHGNGKDFTKKVHLKIRRRESDWDFVVSDEGKGFDPARVRNPLAPERVWGESGRGIFLIMHFMDRAEFWNGGSTVVMTRKR
jgi:anti-sigma regulatory factor (Ser/Thr protein kinase)